MSVEMARLHGKPYVGRDTYDVRHRARLPFDAMLSCAITSTLGRVELRLQSRPDRPSMEPTLPGPIIFSAIEITSLIPPFADFCHATLRRFAPPAACGSVPCRGRDRCRPCGACRRKIRGHIGSKHSAPCARETERRAALLSRRRSSHSVDAGREPDQMASRACRRGFSSSSCCGRMQRIIAPSTNVSPICSIPITSRPGRARHAAARV